MILCDTNILIEFYKDNPLILQELCQIGQNNLAISVITRAELYFGSMDKTELQKIKKHLSLIRQCPISTSVSVRFLELMEVYSLSHKLNIPDALIAATAIEYQLDLYTLNIKDFHFIPDLSLYTPSIQKDAKK